ncbi:MAG: methyltransferase domain-containing protein [Burkholderiales bacterium]
MHLPAVNLTIVQPTGYVHSLGFLDQARFFRHQFRRMGAEVTISKNRLREDAVNFVFGAHLDFPAELRRRHACVFVNLEQLGDGGAAVSPNYLALLRGGAVVDYDASNVAAYASEPADVPIVPFLHAPYLDDGQALPIEERPIDLLFFGSMNPRRQAFVQRVEACGVQVSFLDQPLYGAERDRFVRQARAVLNCHFYGTSRFEQARAFHCLSLGTPVISERTPHTRAPAAFDDAMFWIDEGSIERFFVETFRSPRFGDAARAKLDAFRRHDPIEAYADALAFASGYLRGWQQTCTPGPWRPDRLNLGSGRDYRPGWLNVDVVARTEPDLVLDLSRPLELPAALPGARGGEVLLEAGGLERVHASNVLEHVADLPGLMTTVLALLREGGEMEIEVPYERAPTAWQDPTHLRAMNENSWLYYTDWFWYLGWFEHRFELAASQWLDLNHAPASREQAAFMRVVLRKVATTPGERTLARTLQADFGGIDDDVWRDDPRDAAVAPHAAPATTLVAAPAAPMIAAHAPGSSHLPPAAMQPVRAAAPTAAFPSPAPFASPAPFPSPAPDPVTAASISEAMSRVLVTLSK